MANSSFDQPKEFRILVVRASVREEFRNGSLDSNPRTTGSSSVSFPLDEDSIIQYRPFRLRTAKKPTIE